MIYRIRLRRGRKGERKSFSEADYAALFDAAHQQKALTELAHLIKTRLKRMQY
ncbi:hypothetical protein ABZ897_30255 [Nonomuraea sp. NPDC046802]|uniref:hypothetical protein n=1 Tax=Nonomuraea sp. NPDC046802 TaxID=3154919 RepID=UPI0033D8D8FF